MHQSPPASGTSARSSVLIAGAGIGGLTAALFLHRAGIDCQLIEAVPELAPVGVGITLLPYAAEQLGLLGLESALSSDAILTQEERFFNRFGQLVYHEPTGRFAGHTAPQYSIHRAHLHSVLYQAVTERLGPDSVLLGHRLTGFAQDADGVTASVVRSDGATCRLAADVLIGADGIHSVIRKVLFANEGPPRYSGVMMWRGTSVADPFLTGATMFRAGTLATGQLVCYPIKNDYDGRGRQLVNWVVELESPQRSAEDWNRTGCLEDFIGHFADWHFEWLDVPALLASAQTILEYPMVDREPLPRWSHDRVTLLGDAAHPMIPRGSNGAGQTILDARALAECLAASPTDPVQGLAHYDQRRRPATSAVVVANRTRSPDSILRLVAERSGDAPFDRLEDVVSQAELRQIFVAYAQITTADEAARASAAP